MEILMILFWIFVALFVACTIGWIINVKKKDYTNSFKWGIAANIFAILVNICKYFIK